LYQDSLNVRFIGNWPFGPATAIAYDPVRHLGFLGSGGGVYILNLQIPSIPIKLSESIHTCDTVFSLFYSEEDSLLLVASLSKGLEIWDITNPFTPIKLGVLNARDEIADVTVTNTYAYVADRDFGLRVINISNPASPYEVGYYDTVGLAYDVEILGPYAYVADHYAGVLVIDISNPNLMNRRIPAGTHNLVWNYRNLMGTYITNGIYFLSFQTRSFNTTKKLVVLH